MGLLFEKKEETKKEIKRTYQGIIEMLSLIIDSVDRQTRSHSYRVSVIAEMIAKEMRCPEVEVENIRIAALLHDLGKMGVSAEILHKIGDLSSQEREHMKIHPKLGMDVLAPVGGRVLQLLPLIIHHHEKYDGKGYIHIDPQEREVKLRERIDGLMTDVMQIPKWVQGAVTSRIKIMAKMDISERRIPQDGRIKVRVEGRDLDLRVSTLPTQYGETIVMRILYPKTTTLTLDKIGLSPYEKDRVRDIIERPQGIVIVTGPTGSGKTSTLYAMISHIKTPAVNIITLEDPIEYKLEGVNQVAINEKAGLTFAYCLRSVLRQDLDVIFLGETRDQETAEIAHQASVTGHLVFTSLHTTDAVSSITRLKNMGIPPYLIASALNGIVAQRLARKICESCKESYNPTDEELLRVGIKAKRGDRAKINFYRGMGCDNCGKSGYQGRIGIFEVLVVNTKIKDMIVSDEPEDAIRKVAIASGMVPMHKDGLAKVGQGITTIAEFQRVIFAREQEKEREKITILCPNCSQAIDKEFSTCPYCGSSVILNCPSCGKERNPDWNYCPYCRTEVSYYSSFTGRV